MNSDPRVMIAAPSSGSGKTLVTCGILQALVNRGLDVASFKCGPDYIDPMFHSRVIGTRSKNLDAFFCDDNTLRYLFKRTADTCDISVIEGVMGFYDGMGIADTTGSSHDISRRLDVPVVLLVNCRGASLSVVPVIQGFLSFRENNIKAVILNNMSEKVCARITPEIEALGVKVLGYVPKMKDLNLESRHLGLCLPSEVEELREKLNRLAATLEETLDIDMLVELAGTAPGVVCEAPEVEPIGSKVRIGLADDDTFCFTYEDNIELLQRCGAEIVRFSPMHDDHLPDVDGIVLSGGYPELHADVLSSNTSMLEDIRRKVSDGMPCIAECGGFMYLHEHMEDKDGVIHDMCGVIPGTSANSGKLSRFGYITLDSDPDGTVGGMKVKGHEFHYWDSDNCGSSWHAMKTNGTEYRCMHDTGTMVAGYPHLYYYSNPSFATEFLRRASEYHERCHADRL